MLSKLLVASRPHLKQPLRSISFIANCLEKHGIVPDVIACPPDRDCEVKFECVSAKLGNTLTPCDTQKRPNVKWKIQQDTCYSICMTDPDQPCREYPELREWHHWLVVNIPGNAIRRGDVLSEYIAPIPGEGTGKHRYVILVYEQNNKVCYKGKTLTNKSVNQRCCFSIEKFAKKYKLGKLIAANFFYACYDEYVPVVYKQLGLV